MANEQLRIPLTINALTDAPQVLRLFYAKQPDGTFAIALDGEPPGYVKAERLEEFRSNNRALNAAATEADAKVAALTTERDKTAAELVAVNAKFEGVDPAEYRALKARPDDAARAADLETALTAERSAHAATQFRNTIGWEFLKAGGRPEALDFLVTRAAGTFSMKDGKVTTAAFSARDPGVSLGVPEWIAAQLSESSFAFLPSKGGGSTPGQGGAPAKRVVASDDPYAFGQNLEDIASGKAEIR